MKILSNAFENGEFIPEKYTCDGIDISPALKFIDIPENTKSLALIVEDPDAPIGVFTHWVVYDIPPNITGFPEGMPKEPLLEYGIKQGINDFDKIGYNGPCPPPGKPHRYFFILVALNIQNVGLAPGATKNELIKAINGHIIDKAELIGLYRR
ncbi:YbhB/YbcL family Raf kinase inhibitor-like protein [Hydrogenothermus marinus]|uniref:PBP family phospholipid-binding protein n=1 Tax=Hydrogenothermus marinus TaxID=133270 RepID=A0A3M0BTE1_9AQUI|nr:YbhB/YbcL family Raf kinase inhibitor-like protein [Hydrogenothermus marinus]RMA97805.1 hypothetical protein CLV39_0434 [Hydrogenothermus marinus]